MNFEERKDDSPCLGSPLLVRSRHTVAKKAENNENFEQNKSYFLLVIDAFARFSAWQICLHVPVIVRAVTF